MLHGDFELKLKSLMLSKNKLLDLLFYCFNMQVSTYIRKTIYMALYKVINRSDVLNLKNIKDRKIIKMTIMIDKWTRNLIH